jgi:thymidylate synthase (FAD)
MNVKLVNSTPNPEFFISYIARVSSPDNQENPDYAKLIKYLLKNKHFSPFEHSYFTFQIVTSRALTAQILRHRSLTFQELSQRYTVVDAVEPIELRKQAVKNRQSSEEVFDPIVDPGADYRMHASDIVSDIVNDAQRVYQKLIDLGVAKECARMILPMATQTTLYATGSVRSWIHYLNLRNDEHTQKEHQLIAQEIESILRLYVPTVFEALDTLKAEGWTM